MRYTAEDYVCVMNDGTMEYGWSVKDGEDTVCDVRTKHEAVTVAALLNGEAASWRDVQ